MYLWTELIEWGIWFARGGRRMFQRLRRRRSQLEKEIKKRNGNLVPWVRERQSRHADGFTDAEAIGPVLDACRITKFIFDDDRDVFLESGTALAEYARHLIGKDRQGKLEVRTNSDIVDTLLARETGFTVHRLVGGDGYDKAYSAFYADRQATLDLIRGGAELVVMTASSVDLTPTGLGPHSREKNASFKTNLLKAARPCQHAEGNWKGAPVVLVTEVSKLKLQPGTRSIYCEPVYRTTDWPEFADDWSGTQCFIEDIRNGFVTWVIYSSKEIESNVVDRLRTFKVRIREVKSPEDQAFGYVLDSPRCQLSKHLEVAAPLSIVEEGDLTIAQTERGQKQTTL